MTTAVDWLSVQNQEAWLYNQLTRFASVVVIVDWQYSRNIHISEMTDLVGRGGGGGSRGEGVEGGWVEEKP